MPPRSQKRRIASRSDASGLRLELKADVDATATTVQKRVSSERRSPVSSTSSLTSIDGLLVFP